MQRLKRTRLALIIFLGLIPLTPLPMAVQVGLAVADVVLLMILSRIARDPGTKPDDPA